MLYVWCSISINNLKPGASDMHGDWWLPRQRSNAYWEPQSSANNFFLQLYIIIYTSRFSPRFAGNPALKDVLCEPKHGRSM